MTQEQLAEHFDNAFDDATEEAGGFTPLTVVNRTKLWEVFLPHIQEYVKAAYAEAREEIDNIRGQHSEEKKSLRDFSLHKD